MTETSAIMIPEASALTVDTSCIDLSEVETQEDKDFLQEKGTNILQIVARAALEVGRELVEIQEYFRDQGKTGLIKYYASIGITKEQAAKWSNKYRAYSTYVEVFGADQATNKFNGLGDTAVSRIWTLPTEYRMAFLADIALGEEPTADQVQEVASRTEVKLSQAEELLEAARKRKASEDKKWKLITESPENNTDHPDYKRNISTRSSIQTNINQYEKRIKDLQQEIEDEKVKVAEYERREEKTKSELEKLRFDDDSTREERIKRLTNSLTISVPQVMADLQKFFTEKDHYPTDVREHLLEQSVYLTNYIADQLDS